MTLYRVVSYIDGAKAHEPGGPFFIPPQGRGRLDNPDLYSVLYAGENRVGCVAEAFGRIPVWTASMFGGFPLLPGSLRALVTFETTAPRSAVRDLDDPRALVEHSLRPSDVITRDYADTRAWARSIFSRRRWRGVRWWSYYESRWANVGLWDPSGLKLKNIEPLTSSHEAVEAAAAALSRVFEQD
jgi:hypothetical protein